MYNIFVNIMISRVFHSDNGANTCALICFLATYLSGYMRSANTESEVRYNKDETLNKMDEGQIKNYNYMICHIFNCFIFHMIICQCSNVFFK